MKTILTYRVGGVTYKKVFASQVSYGTIEQFLIVEKRIGRSQVNTAIVGLENLL